jgi:hypothetical protein
MTPQNPSPHRLLDRGRNRECDPFESAGRLIFSTMPRTFTSPAMAVDFSFPITIRDWFGSGVSTADGDLHHRLVQRALWDQRKPGGERTHIRPTCPRDWLAHGHPDNTDTVAGYADSANGRSHYAIEGSFITAMNSMFSSTMTGLESASRTTADTVSPYLVDTTRGMAIQTDSTRSTLGFLRLQP